MPPTGKVPLLAARAGARCLIALPPSQDRVYRALDRLRTDPTIAGPPPILKEEPSQDDRAYEESGSTHKYCRPLVGIARRRGWQEGPLVHFETREDGLHLTAVFDEKLESRAPGAMPFWVRVTAVRLSFGAEQLDFPTPLLQPEGDPSAGPAFSITVDALLTDSDKCTRLVSAMQGSGPGAQWVVSLELPWRRETATTITRDRNALFDRLDRMERLKPRAAGELIERHLDGRLSLLREMPLRRPLGDPGPQVPGGRQPGSGSLEQAIGRRVIPPLERGGLPVADETLSRASRSDLLHAILERSKAVPSSTTVTIDTLAVQVERTFSAVYPKSAPENKHVYAAVDGQPNSIEWQSTDHGWICQTEVPDTVYCLPDSYLLAVDEVRGLPAIEALLLRNPNRPATATENDPAFYATRLTFRVVPFSQLERLAELRSLIRTMSGNQSQYVDLALGGYTAARFIPDDALKGIGSLFAGYEAEAKADINPAVGFSLTFQGDAEFTGFIYDKLQGEGLRGDVELDLKTSKPEPFKYRVPVVLSTRQLAPLTLPTVLKEADGNAIVVQVQNPCAIGVQMDGVQAYGLQRSANFHRVQAWWQANVDGASKFPLSLESHESASINVRLDDEQAVPNAWDIAFVGCRPRIQSKIALDMVFDLATGGVPGLKIDISCVPFVYWDKLKPEEKSTYEDVVGVEVMVRRSEKDPAVTMPLSRDPHASGSVLLVRTVADFIGDRSAAKTFQYRVRLLRPNNAPDWSTIPWREQEGTTLSFYFT